MKRSRWQFGLLALTLLITASAIVFAVLRPPVFPGDDSIRSDLGIPKSIQMFVYDRQTVTSHGKIVYWATVHVAEQPHRLVRVWCTASDPLGNRENWEPFVIHEQYDNGTAVFRFCERLYGKPPTEAEHAEFREFVANFR